MRKIGISLAALAVAGAMSLSSGGAANAGTLSINYYETPSLPTSTPAGTNDFGTCCSSPPATLEGITVGALLGPDGLPVNQGNVIDVNGLGEILWWSPPRLGASSPNQITYTGSGHFTVGTVASPYTSNMFAPNSMGTNDGTKFETAVLLGTLTGHGADVELKVGSDDDTLVYLDGSYVGGDQGVHSETITTLNLGSFTGPESLEIFYADRAQVGAVLSLGVTGAAVPESSTWAMMLAGFGGLGFAAFRRSHKTPIAIA